MSKSDPEVQAYRTAITGFVLEDVNFGTEGLTVIWEGRFY